MALFLFSLFLFVKPVSQRVIPMICCSSEANSFWFVFVLSENGVFPGYVHTEIPFWFFFFFFSEGEVLLKATHRER